MKDHAQLIVARIRGAVVRTGLSLRWPRDHRGVKHSARPTRSNVERERLQKLRMRGAMRALSGNGGPRVRRDRRENARTIDARAYFRTTFPSNVLDKIRRVS